MLRFLALALVAVATADQPHASIAGPLTLDTDVTVEIPQTLFPTGTWGPKRSLTSWSASATANQQYCSPTDPPQDCDALVKLFDAIDQARSYYTMWDGYNMIDVASNHTLQGKWKNGKSFCTWERVTCAGYGDPTNFLPSRRRVYRLDLSRMNLNGTLPVELGNLTDLVHLDLSWNRFTGQIPNTIGQMTKLQQLSMHHNKLDGSIPASINELTKVNTIELGHNFLSGSIPTQLNQLQHLERLSLRRNQITQTLPASLCSLNNLEYLVAWDNKLSGSVPACLCTKETGQSGNMRQVKLQKNLLTGGVPASLGNCKNLNWLDVSDNQMTGNIPANLTACTKLKHINAFHNSLSGISEAVNKNTMPWLRDFIVDHDLQPHY